MVKPGGTAQFNSSSRPPACQDSIGFKILGFRVQRIGYRAWKVLIIHWGSIGRMEKKMETTTMYWGYIGTMESNNSILGLYWDNGKENGHYYSILGYIGTMEQKMETTIVYGRGIIWTSELEESSSPTPYSSSFSALVWV